VISPHGGSAPRVHQDASVYVSALDRESEIAHEVDDGRGTYLYVIEGGGGLNGQMIGTGDAAKVTGPETLTFSARSRSELILVDVPIRFQPVGIWRRSPR
jgi:redox-sensitive bicupin YhaK (pirin superfamily)